MFGFNVFPEIVRPFNVQYRSYPVHMLSGNERDELEKGGKIIMPPSALDQLARLNINYPMLFKLTNKQTDRITHCGVLEFVAEEGRVYIPQWMMNNLLLNMGDYLSVESANLQVATFSRFQPQSADFLDITNPKAVLENGLRLFACLTTGDIIAIKYNDHIYELCVLETQPGPAVSIIECDMNVEFAPPLGYKDPETVSKKKDEEMVIDPTELMPEPSGFVAFKGEGNRLDGKKKKGGSQAEDAAAQKMAHYKRGIPDYDYIIGTLKFIRNARPTTSKENKENVDEFKAFCGEGNTLRSKKKWRGTD